MVIIVKYYQYNGFLFNNNIGTALLIRRREEAPNKRLRTVDGYNVALRPIKHTHTHIYNIDVLPARLPFSYSTV